MRPYQASYISPPLQFALVHENVPFRQLLPFLLALIFSYSPDTATAQGNDRPFFITLGKETGEPIDHQTQRTDSSFFTIIEKMPEYPGGDRALLQFIGEVLIYPDEAIAQGIQGVVYVNYVVRADGTIGNIKVERGAHPLLDTEAVRVVNLIRGYTPGRQKGKNVPVQFTIPIRFVLTRTDASCDQGVAAYRTGNYDLALKQLDKCIDAGQNNPSARFYRAMALFHTQSTELALQELNYLIAGNGHWATKALMSRALFLLEKEDYQAALADLNLVISRDSTSAEALKARSKCYLNLQQTAEACADLEWSLRLYSDDVETMKALGTILMNRGNPDKAVGVFTMLIGLRPKSSEAFYLRGLAHSKLKRLTEACSDVQRAKELGQPGLDSLIDVLCR